MIRLGLIGLGYWGPNFVRICQENDNVELAYCCDVDKQALAKIDKRYPAVNLVSDYEKILKDQSVKGVIVVTPPITHYKIVKDCLLAGKDVLVEKPITLKSEDAEKLVELAKNKGRVLMVDHIFQFNPVIRKLKQIMDKRKLGKIFYISGSYTALGPVRADINSMWDLAPHFFYVLEFLLGKSPLWVSTIGGSYLKKKTEDVAYITLGFPGKILANIHVSWLYPYKIRNLVIVGRKKMAVFDDTALDQKLKIFEKGAYYDKTSPDYPTILKVIYREGDLLIPKIEPKEPLNEVLHTFIEGIESRNLYESDGEAGKNVVKILEASQKSLEKNGQVIKIL